MSNLALDLSYVHKEFNRGDLSVIITWLFGGADRATAQPCMVIKRNITSLNDQEWVPVCITLDNAWKWDPDTWLSEHSVVFEARQFAEALGFNGTSHQVVLGIVGVINDHLSDLLTCPPAPRIAPTAHARVRVINPDTGEKTEGELPIQ